jgi:aminoglycoside 6-adenylyltransferase
MKSESSVLSDLMSWAFESDNVRMIALNGSRGDPGRVPDLLSDYDVAVFVNDLAPILDDRWLDRFGEIMVRSPLRPESTLDPAWITQLVLFSDGVRIDFQFTTPATTKIEQSGPYHCVLVDKDRLSESISGVPVEGATIELPSEAEFADRINAFWWDIPYVAKALHRSEIDYARYVMEGDLRFNKLHPLIRWHIGVRHGTATDAGIFGRWFARYLEDEIWEAYLETYSGADPEDQWRAMFAMTRFVEMLGKQIASELGFTYPEEIGSRVEHYLHRVRQSAGACE